MMKACGHRGGAAYGCAACVADVRARYPQFPLQVERRGKTKPGPVSVPWSVAERAWVAYAQRYGTEQSVERLAERGGFGWSEMDDLFPGWRDATDAWLLLAREMDLLKTEVSRLTLELEAFRGAAP